MKYQMARVNLTVTNKDEEEKNAGILAGVLLYQDGVALEHVTCTVLKDEDITDGDEVYNGYKVFLGETVECSALFYPRTKSPVEAVIENKFSDKRLGACFDLESVYAETEAASAADKAIIEKMVGTWDLNDDFPEKITFKADLTGVHDMMGDLHPFTYTVTDGVLSLKYDDGDEADYKVSVNGDDMVLTDTIFQDNQNFVRAN